LCPYSPVSVFSPTSQGCLDGWCRWSKSYQLIFFRPAYLSLHHFTAPPMSHSWMQPRLRPLGNTFVNFPLDEEEADKDKLGDGGSLAPPAPAAISEEPSSMSVASVGTGSSGGTGVGGGGGGVPRPGRGAGTRRFAGSKRGCTFPGYVPYGLQEGEEDENNNNNNENEADAGTSAESRRSPPEASSALTSEDMDMSLGAGMPPWAPMPGMPTGNSQPTGAPQVFDDSAYADADSGLYLAGQDEGPPPPMNAPQNIGPGPGVTSYSGTPIASSSPNAMTNLPMMPPAAFSGQSMTSPTSDNDLGGQSPGFELSSMEQSMLNSDQSTPAALRPGVTTLMVRNLPLEMLQNDLVRELENSGLLLFCDFLYMPSSFGTRRGKGYAFVNFNIPQAAEIFFNTWHKSRRFGMASNVTLNVSAAVVQGRDANVNRWDSAKMRRVKNANYRPYIPGVNNVPELPSPYSLPLPPNPGSAAVERRAASGGYSPTAENSEYGAAPPENVNGSPGRNYRTDSPMRVQVGAETMDNKPRGDNSGAQSPMQYGNYMQQPPQGNLSYSPTGNMGGGFGFQNPAPGQMPMTGLCGSSGMSTMAAGTGTGTMAQPQVPLAGASNFPSGGGYGQNPPPPPPPQGAAPVAPIELLGQRRGNNSVPSPQNSPQAEIVPGRCVQITGLVQAAQFNGRWGIVEDYDPQYQRFTVRIAGSGMDLSAPPSDPRWERAGVKRDNLQASVRPPAQFQQAYSPIPPFAV